MKLKNCIIFSISTLMLAGCTSEDITNTPDDERLPLRLEATLSTSRPVTRAAGDQFDADDELQCYIRHIYSTDLNSDKNYEEVQAYKKLVTFYKNGEPTEKQYWDDYSDSDNDLRTSNHALQSYYGYCYNGGTPTTDLVEKTGVLGWTTAGDQTADGAMKANDLLWSKSQDPVSYVHAKENRKGLEIPYTHAMSKFTIVIVASDGFASTDLSSATVTLSGMNSKGTFTAPTTTVDVSEATPIEVKMYGNAILTPANADPNRAYEAVVVPKTNLRSDGLFATIKNLGGNDYNVDMTSSIRDSWKDGLNDDKTKSGYNYKLTITLKKQTVGVVASLADWSDVSATGTGEIQFDTDITSIDKDNAATLKSGDAFSLWMSTDKDNMGSVATTSVFDGSNFENTPAIYWPNGSDNYYFRALAKGSTDTNKTMEAASLDDVDQGTDLLWGTTAAHKGNTTIDYAEGVAINPRTGFVPLIFKHAMSNVIIALATTNDASAVDLDGAKVTLTNLSNTGTINIGSGLITAGTVEEDNAVKLSTNFSNLFMIPQTIGDKAKLIITLTDDTTYSLQLNTCEDASNTAIATWESGKQYKYTITLKKEAVKFRVLVQDWTPTTGSGNATLDWD